MDFITKFLKPSKKNITNIRKNNTKTKNNTNNKSNRKKPLIKKLEHKVVNVTNYNNIEKKKFKINGSLRIQFLFNSELLNADNIYIASLKGIDEKNYILLSSDLKRMYFMMLFVCKFKLKPGFVKYSKTLNLNPFSNDNSSKTFYYIIFKSDRLSSLKSAILQKLINFYEFKKGFFKLLQEYSELNNEYGFLYNNIHLDSICINFVNRRKDIIFMDYTYSSDSEHKNSNTNKLTKEYKKMKKFFKLDKLSESIKGNYDIINIIIIMNICSHYLNEIPNEFILNKDDIKELNKKSKLNTKIDYLLKKDFFKIA